MSIINKLIPSRNRVFSGVETTKARYEALCRQRDATNERVRPLLEKREALNQEIQAAQAEALAISAQVDAIRGGETWLDLKKEIGMLAKALSGIR